MLVFSMPRQLNDTCLFVDINSQAVIFVDFCCSVCCEPFVDDNSIPKLVFEWL